MLEGLLVELTGEEEPEEDVKPHPTSQQPDGAHHHVARARCVALPNDEAREAHRKAEEGDGDDQPEWNGGETCDHSEEREVICVVIPV